MQKVAIFDTDGTIFRSSLLVELVNALVAEGVFPKRAAQMYARERLAWLDRKGNYEAYVMAVVSSFTAHIKGVAYADFARIAEEAVAEQKDRVYRFTRDLIKNLKKRGYFLLAISHSPKSILDHFCRRLGFNKVYGMVFELGPTDRFTGVVVDEHIILNKALILKRAVLKEKLTLQGSIGVGDTESDIPFLELVTEPICFNPNATLYAHAKRNGWRVVVERKDVIYEINADRRR